MSDMLQLQAVAFTVLHMHAADKLACLNAAVSVPVTYITCQWLCSVICVLYRHVTVHQRQKT